MKRLLPYIINLIALLILSKALFNMPYPMTSEYGFIYNLHLSVSIFLYLIACALSDASHIKPKHVFPVSLVVIPFGVWASTLVEPFSTPLSIFFMLTGCKIAEKTVEMYFE